MYQLPKLDYLFQDLEPYIDIHTMGLHYYKHHQSYINNLNKLLLDNRYDYRYSLEELIFHINQFPIAVQKNILFNLSGVLNHNLYWKSIDPNKREKPNNLLRTYIENTFGSYEDFWKIFKEQALKQKGSGYTFLVLKNNGGLDVINTSNQESPLLNGCIPLFNIDMWEHAYYLNYENDKEKYLDNFKMIVDFTYANQVFEMYMKKKES